MGIAEWAALAGNLGEFIAAIVVIFTLVYLAIQVRHSKEATEANTRQMRGQAFVHLAAVVRDQLTWLRDNPEHFDVITKSHEDWHSLTQEEQRVAALWNQDEATYHELAFVLWQEGALDEQSYLSRESYFVSVLISSGGRAWWDAHVYLLDQRFIDRINEKLAEADRSGAEPFTEHLPMYKPRAESP